MKNIQHEVIACIACDRFQLIIYSSLTAASRSSLCLDHIWPVMCLSLTANT